MIFVGGENIVGGAGLKMAIGFYDGIRVVFIEGVLGSCLVEVG